MCRRCLRRIAVTLCIIVAAFLGPLESMQLGEALRVFQSTTHAPE